MPEGVLPLCSAGERLAEKRRGPWEGFSSSAHPQPHAEAWTVPAFQVNIKARPLHVCLQTTGCPCGRIPPISPSAENSFPPRPQGDSP